MLNRYVVSIQNPQFGRYVFVWDRKEKKLVYSDNYPVQFHYYDKDTQQSAIRKAENYIYSNLKQEEL